MQEKTLPIPSTYNTREKSSWITSMADMQKNTYLCTVFIILFPAVVLSIGAGLRGDFVTIGNLTGAIMNGLYSVHMWPYAKSGIKERRFGYFIVLLHAFVMAFGIFCIFDAAQDRLTFLRPGFSFTQGFCSDPIRIKITENRALLLENDRRYNMYMERMKATMKTLQSQASALGVSLDWKSLSAE